MGRQARLKRQRKEERDRPLKEMAERIYMSGDRVLDENGEPIEFTSVEELEKYLKESAKGNDVDKLEGKMDEAYNESLAELR